MRLTAPGIILVALVSLLALLVYVAVNIVALRARARHNVAAPATTGPPGFERALRVQANTLEQLVPFQVALWLCALYLQPLFAAIIGVVWVVGRIVYAVGYLGDPRRRGPGFAISFAATLVLIIGALVGVVLAYLRQP